jgi:hypothetical protein
MVFTAVQEAEEEVVDVTLPVVLLQHHGFAVAIAMQHHQVAIMLVLNALNSYYYRGVFI